MNLTQKKIKNEFPGFSLEDINELLTFSEIVTYKKEETIIEPSGIAPDYFYYVFNGLVRGYAFTDDKDQINLYFTESKKYFVARKRLLEGKDVQNDVGFEAVTEVTLLKIDYSVLLNKCSQKDTFFDFYHSGLRSILGTLSDRISMMIIADANKRYEHLCNTRPIIVDFAQKRHIAQFLGITPNSFSRILSSKFKS